MNPLRVSAANYGPYPTVDWEIPDGLTAIMGVNGVGDGANSNGSGKTKLLELVPICLFGPAMPWSEYLTVGVTDELRIELEFEHGGDHYRIRRIFDPRGRGKTTLDFERATAPARAELEAGIKVALEGEDPGLFHDTWEPLTRDSQAETQKAINQTIGLSESTFAHSVFAGQGARHFADPSLPPRERKAILNETLGLEVWDMLLELVRADVRDVEGSLAKIAATLESIEGDLVEREGMEERHAAHVDAVEHAAAKLVEVEASHKEVSERATAATNQQNAFLEEVRKLESLRAREKELEDQAAAGVAALTEAAEIEKRAKPLADVAATAEPLGEELAALVLAQQMRGSKASEKAARSSQAAGAEGNAQKLAGEARDHQQRASELQESLEQVLSGQTTICPHCKQAITSDAGREASATAIRSDIAVLEDRARELTVESQVAGESGMLLRREASEILVPDEVDPEALADLNRRLSIAKTAGTNVAALRERYAACKAMGEHAESAPFLEMLTAARKAVTEAEQAAIDLPCPDAEAVAALVRAAEFGVEALDNARKFVTGTKEALAVSGERMRRLEELAGRAQESILARVGLQDRLNHLKALERAYGRDGVPALILEAAAIPQVEAEAQRVLELLGMPFRIELVTQRENKGGGLKDTLDVVVHEPNGVRRYETYSGGERTRLEWALRIALARLIVGRSGADVGMLALDEPAFLDATGMDQMVEALRGLTEFRAIVLVSHDERLVDAFDHTVTVIRDESGSRLEEAA